MMHYYKFYSICMDHSWTNWGPGGYANKMSEDSDGTWVDDGYNASYYVRISDAEFNSYSYDWQHNPPSPPKPTTTPCLGG